MKLITNQNTLTQQSIKLLLTMSLVLAVPALGGYDLSWSTIDGGGGQSSGGPYVLTGTIGQPDAGWGSGDSYELLGGFLPGGPICIVDLYSFAKFAEHWLDTSCDIANDWCGGADLDQLGDVDGVDLGLFVDEWLNYCPYNWPLR